MDRWQVAQAVEFMRALRAQLGEMTARLAWIERQGAAGRSSREIRVEAATLRRDISEAQAHIDRLQRRYLSGDACPPPVAVDLPASSQALGAPKGGKAKKKQ